jgi:glycosyltransferase involved in cell wall biosynthesis
MSAHYRVLLVTDAYGLMTDPQTPRVGGADRSVRLLALELTKRGHTVAVATTSQHRMPAREVSDGIEVHRVRDLTALVPWVSADPYKHIPPPFPDPEAVLRFRRLIKRFSPDIVHSYGWLTYSCALALVGSSIPLVLSVRDYGNFCAVRTLLYRDGNRCSGPAPLKCLGCAGDHYGRTKGAVAVAGVLGGRRLLARTISGVHSNSRHTQDVTWRHLLAGRTTVARGSAADAVIPPFRDDSSDGAPDPAILARLPESYILFVGALRSAKGIGDLLAAHEGLPDAPPLVLIGTREIDTPETFPARTTVLESVPHSTVMAAWERALFGVFPSRAAEPLGNVVHEAMSRGRAVIGTTPGGHGEMIVDGEAGLLVPGGDVEALRRAMRQLIEDVPLRERLGARASELAATFTADRTMASLEALYQAVSAPSHRDTTASSETT